MGKRKYNSRALRQLAEQILREIAEDYELADEERDGLVTSLVRQWITYDGNAALFLGEQQVYLALGRTPLGKPCIIPAPGLGGWTKQLTQDWKIDPNDLDEIFEQLNRGQSAEVINRDGLPLRLWVNPKERGRGVELLVKEPVRPGLKRDYRKIAAHELERLFSETLDPEESDELACSVAKQWQQFDGHACLFLIGHEQLDFRLRELGDGMCEVVTQSINVDLEAALSSLGFPPEVVPDVLTRINLGQEVEFRDREGIPSLLWHDPKAKRVIVRPLQSVSPSAGTTMQPVFCPNCNAVLKPWQEGERQQSCPQCGQTTTLS